MTLSKVLLADGTDGMLSKCESYRSLSCVQGVVWALQSCGKYVDVLDPHDGDVIDTVSLPEVCTQVQCVAERLWFLTPSGQIIIYDFSGMLLGVLDAQAGKIENIHSFYGSPSFLATSQKGAFQIWDSERLIVQRVFSCEGGVILAIFPIYVESLLFFLSVQEDRIALWSMEISYPISVNLLEEASSAVLVRSSCGNTLDDRCWIGGLKWITVFRILSDLPGTVYMKKERLIPCAKVRQLLSVSSLRVISLDTEFLVTVWDSCEYVPVRMFKIDTAMSIERTGEVLPTLFFAGVARVQTLWTLCGNMRLAWEDRVFKDDVIVEDTTHKFTRAVMYSENLRLRKKNYCLLEMINAYRKNIINCVSNTSSDNASISSTITTLDKCFGEQSAILRCDDDKPQERSSCLLSLTEQVNYWRDKYTVEKERNVLLLSDLRLAADSLKLNGCDSTFSSQMVDLLALNCANRARESELCSRVLQLEAQLYKLDAVESDKIELPDIKGHDIESCRARVAELEKELRYAVEVGEGTVTAQRDILNITVALEEVRRAFNIERDKVASLTKHASVLEGENEKLLNTVTYLQEELRKSQWQNKEWEQLIKRQELQMMENAKRSSLELAEKTEELNTMRQRANKAREDRLLASEVALRDAEIVGLKKQLEYVKQVMSTGHKEDLVVRNTCDSIIHFFQSFKRDSPITQLVDILNDIDSRLGHLNASAKLLMEKDDQMAVKEDKISFFKDRIQILESKISSLSLLFDRIPYSAEDIESLLFELNEYRQRYGRCEEIDEVVEVHMLELAAARNSVQHVEREKEMKNI